MSKAPALDAPVASTVPAIEVAEQALEDLRAGTPALTDIAPPAPAPLTQELALGNGVVLPEGFSPPPGFDPSAFKPDTTPAPVMPSTEELMAQGAAAVEKDNVLLEESGITGLEPWMNNPTYDADVDDSIEIPASLPVAEPAADPVDPAKEATSAPTIDISAYDLTAPAFVQSAQAMGLTPEAFAQLLSASDQEAPATPAPAPTPQTPTEMALQAQLEAMQAQIAQITQRQQQEAEEIALAEAEAQSAASRAEFEASQRAAYEAQYEHLDDVDREEIVGKLLGADLLQWDSEAGLASARAQAEALAFQQAEAKRDAEFAAFATDMTAKNPTMALEVAPGFTLANFITETYRAACDAYGAEKMGELAPYAAAFEKTIKDIQTNAVKHGIAIAEGRGTRSRTAPPVVNNRGGGGSPTNPPVATAPVVRPGANQLFGHLRTNQVRR